MIEQKIWGTTECLIDTPQMQLHRIIVKPGGYCSDHRHHGRANVFYVVSGRIQVHHIDTNGDLVSTVAVSAGGHCSVPPGTRHQFAAPDEAEVLEIYYPVLRLDDIERFSEGGVL